MALSLVDVGTTANDGTGDPLRTAFQTVNTALTAVNNAVVVGTGTTTFKDDSGSVGVAVASNGNVTVTTLFQSGGKGADDASSAGIFTARGSYAPGVEIKNYDAAGWARFDLNHESASNPTLFYQDASGTAYFRNDSNAATSFEFSYAGTSIMRALSNRDTQFYNAGSTAGTTWDASALSNAGAWGVGTATPTEQLDLSGDAIRIRTAQTPASAAAAGDAGIICWDASYIYVCTATNTWKRAAITTW